MGHFRQRGRCAELAPMGRRNKTSSAVRRFVDIASQAAADTLPAPTCPQAGGHLSEGWGNLSEGLNWARPPVLGNGLNPDRIRRARARNWRHAVHFKQTNRTLPQSRSRVQRACCTLRQRNRQKTALVRRNRFPGKSPLGPFFDPPFGGYGREGGSVHMLKEREKAAGAWRQRHRS
jgi:hypothetical protein